MLLLKNAIECAAKRVNASFWSCSRFKTRILKPYACAGSIKFPSEAMFSPSFWCNLHLCMHGITLRPCAHPLLDSRTLKITKSVKETSQHRLEFESIKTWNTSFHIQIWSTFSFDMFPYIIIIYYFFMFPYIKQDIKGRIWSRCFPLWNCFVWSSFIIDRAAVNIDGLLWSQRGEACTFTGLCSEIRNAGVPLFAWTVP